MTLLANQLFGALVQQAYILFPLKEDYFKEKVFILLVLDLTEEWIKTRQWESAHENGSHENH